MRYEIKIPILSSYHYFFKNWIQKSKGIRKHYGNRFVKSVYYDTNNFKNAQDNIDGISRRSKTRLRWYDDDFKNKNLEIKIKKNNLGEKIFLKLDNFKKMHDLEDIKNFTLKKRDFLNYEDNHKNHQINEYIFDDLKPVSMTTYERSYFKFENLIRITYDQKITYQMFQKNFKQYKKLLDNKNVIEFKFEQKNLHAAKFLLENLNIRPNRFSKYLRSLYFFNKAIYY